MECFAAGTFPESNFTNTKILRVRESGWSEARVHETRGHPVLDGTAFRDERNSHARPAEGREMHTAAAGAVAGTPPNTLVESARCWRLQSMSKFVMRSLHSS